MIKPRLLCHLASAVLPMMLVSPAHAETREYCPDRPGIGTPACTMAPGEGSLEVGLGDWTLDRDREQRQDVLSVGDALLRYGIADHAEVQVGWMALGFARIRDRLTGDVEHSSGTGDVTLALRRNLAHPHGSGLSVALMPFVTVPVGREPIGAGDWSAGVLVPLSVELSNTWSFATTSEFDAAVDEDGHGRHFAFNEVVGATAQLSDAVSATAEYAVTFDRDPLDKHVEHVSGVSLAWLPRQNLQLDLGANLGLDHDADTAEVYFGVSRRF
jgi:hypothetical protein